MSDLTSDSMVLIVADDKAIRIGEILSHSIFEQRGVNLITVNEEMLAHYIALGVQATKDILQRQP